MNIPDEIAVAGLCSLVSLQAWQVRQIFEIKQAVALLTKEVTKEGAKESTGEVTKGVRPRKRPLLTTLLILALPWALLLLAACQPLDTALLRAVPSHPAPSATGALADTNATLLEVRPGLQSGLDTARAASSYLPSPYGQGFELGLGLLSGALALYARRRNAQARAQERQLRAVIKGIEQLPTEEARQAKRSIRSAAVLADVAPELHRTVKGITEANRL